MNIILLKDIEKLGDKHEVVKIKNGFGRNYLIPKKLGVIANAANLAKLESLKAEEEAAEMAKKDVYQGIADALTDKVLKIGVKAGTTGKIFGSVTNIQISQALSQQFDVDVPRKKITLEDEIKEVGQYTATLNLHKEVIVEVPFELIAE